MEELKFIESTENVKHIPWGGDDKMVDTYNMLFNNNIVHRNAILTRVRDKKRENHIFIDVEYNLQDNINDVYHKLIFDYTLYGNCFIEIISSEDRKDVKINRLNPKDCRLSNDDKKIILINDNDSIAKYPLFQKDENNTIKSIAHVREYSPDDTPYGVPYYIAAINALSIGVQIDKWNLNRANTAFSCNGVVLLDDAVNSEEEANTIISTANDKFSGDYYGQKLFIIKDGSETDHSKFMSFPSECDGWLDALTQSKLDVELVHQDTYEEGDIDGEIEYKIDFIIFRQIKDIFKLVKGVEITKSLMRY